MKILVVEDEISLKNDLLKALTISGYTVDSAEDGETAEEMVFVESYDLVLLDINLPKMDGFEVLKKIREYNKNIAIIILTARSDIDDRVRGLDYGANDYMIKPFHFAELEARIRSLLRRKSVQEGVIINHKGFSYDTVSRRCFFSDKEIKLTKKETAILEYLLLNRDRYISQEEFLDHIWGEEVDTFSNTVRVHISFLRRKLKDKLGFDIVKNVIGKGYKIDD